MDLNLKNHVALVQGASKGLGRGIAEALAAEGCNVVLTGRTAEPLQAAASAIAKTHGVIVKAIVSDSGDLAAIPVLLDTIKADFGRLDVIVCNSGGPAPGGLKDLAPEQWLAAAQLLVAAPAALIRAALPTLQASPAPRVFFVTSTSTKDAVAGLLLSNTFRPAVVGMIKALTAELAAERVALHSIAPGRFDTDRLANVINMQSKKFGKTPEAVKQGMIDSIPAGRLGDPLEMGRLVAFLSSPQSDYLRGGNWLVDGGMVRAI